MEYLVGIDMGTTNIKSIVFDTQGNAVSIFSAATPTQSQQDLGRVYNPTELWSIVLSLLSKNVAQIQSDYGGSAVYSISGIAVTGMAEAGVPLDYAGNPLYPIITWYDTRTFPQVALWENNFGPGKLQSIAGLRNQHIFTANKLYWLKENEPGLYQRIAMWHCIPDYISYRLTGKSAIDRSLASRTMMMQMSSAKWSADILDFLGLTESNLPPIIPSGTLIGTVTDSVARECGIPAGVPVYTGGHDHICGAFAVGVDAKGSVLDSCGTSEEVLTVADETEDISNLGSAGYNIGWHTARGKRYMAGGIPASGASIDWCRNALSGGNYDGSVSGANGLLFLPHLRGSSSPSRNISSKGAFVGIRDTHTSSDFMQAVYEGLAFETRLLMENLMRGDKINKVICIGGGAKNDIFLQIKADILQMPIEVPEVNEATALGAAMLAGIGAGVYKDSKDALKHTYRVKKSLLPNHDSAELYHQKFSLYKTLYPLLIDLNCALEHQ